MGDETLLEVRNVTKTFGITVALNNVSFVLKKGEILGLIGENGSGKSTVSSIVAGMQAPDSGEFYFKGEKWSPKSVLEATSKGVAMIVQEAGTIPNITVAENVFLGHENLFSKWIFVNKKKMIEATRELFTKLGIDIDPAEMTGRLDFQQRKLIEVAKALYWKPDLFIVDETTTALSLQGRNLVYKYMDDLKAEGKSVLIISHDLEEMQSKCDRLTVLRDGIIIGTLTKDEYDEDKIKKMMVGREIKGDYYRNDYDGYSDEVVLKADCITTMKSLLCFSLELHKGEILGIGGLSDCGMHNVGKALFGAEEVVDGQVIAPETNTIIKNPRSAIKARIGYISKNRDQESVVTGSPIYDNIASTGYAINKWFNSFIISFTKEKKYVDAQIKELSLKCATPYHNVGTLSGGNKQKVAIAKWLANDSEIIIMDCPTRGIDIGVKASIYKLMYEMKKQGKSILLISEELTELIGMSDRILIMKDGKISAEKNRSENPTENELVNYMF